MNGFTMVGPLVASELILLYCHRSFIKNWILLMVKDISIYTPFLKGFLKTFFSKNVTGHCTKVELFLTSLVADSFLLA